MKLTSKEQNLQGTPTGAVLEHDGKTIEWNIALFDKMSYTGNFDIFAEINAYWAHLAKAEQDQIFATYQAIRDTFDNIWETHELTRRLYGLVKELFDHHELTRVHFWMIFKSDVAWPAALKDSFKDSQEMSGGTREKTYLKDDYQWLVVLSITLRIMIPVWGEFISRTKKEHGTQFKEYYAVQLLAASNIYKSEPMERLRVYVEHSLPPDKSMSAAILGGLSSEDFPTWMLALVLVRRLSVADVRGVDPNANVVTFIYKYIGMKAKGHDQNFIGMVKDKVVEGQGQDGENNLSKLEGYKIKQEIPAGDIAILEYAVQNTRQLVERICPDMPLQFLEMSEISVQALESQRVWPPQLTLMQWVLKPAIPPKSLLYLSKPLILKAMAATQSLLWYRGHYELAALLSAIEQTNVDELQLSGNDSRTRINKDQMEELNALFPYPRKPAGKQKATAKQTNPAAEAIDSLCGQFSEHDWRLTLPAEWVELITGNSKNRRYAVPVDIKVKLANLAISIAKRSF